MYVFVHTPTNVIGTDFVENKIAMYRLLNGKTQFITADEILSEKF